MITINLGQKIVNVPLSYLTFVGIDPVSGRNIYDLDTQTFRTDVIAIMDDEGGIVFDETHIHNTQVTLAGTTFARTIEMINGYQIEFENGLYAVNLKGSNNNFADVAVVNQVSIRSANSAGLIVTETNTGGLTPAQSDALDKVLGCALLQCNVNDTGVIVGPNPVVQFNYGKTAPAKTGGVSC